MENIDNDTTKLTNIKWGNNSNALVKTLLILLTMQSNRSTQIQFQKYFTASQCCKA